MSRSSHRTSALAAGALLVLAAPAAAQIAPQDINAAEYRGGALPDGQSALTARIQVLLDRGDASPGVVDGYSGENVAKAIRGFEAMQGLPTDGEMDDEVWRRLSQDGAAAFQRHEITQDDTSRIVKDLPEDYAKLAEREWLGYTSAAEKIAERFHMDLEFLRQINPDADFDRVGTEVWVAAPGEDLQTSVTRVVADKSLQRLLAYDDAGKLVASYPVTIGSRQTPSPSGTHEVAAVAVESTYTYLPDENFTQGDNTEKLVLPPGPNGPVGLVWIDLSKPTYGIHGTAEPAEIDKTQSHGCVRMTNWDAMELAEAIEVGAPVEFRD